MRNRTNHTSQSNRKNQKASFFLSVSAFSLMSIFTACSADNDSGSFVILQNTIAEVGTNGCAAIGGGTSANTGLISGTLDLDSPSPAYVMFVTVKSLISSSDVVTGADESRRTVFLRGFEVEADYGDLVDEVTAASLAAQGITKYSRAISGFIAPDGTSAIPIDVTNQEFIDDLRGRVAGQVGEQFVNFKIRLIGDVGGNQVRSSQYTFPVNVCTGCLTQDLGECAALPEDFEGAAGHACGLTQDFVLQCCTDGGGATVCPAAADGEN